MYINNLYRYISLYFRVIIRFYAGYIYSVTMPVHKATVMFIHFWMIHIDLDTVFCIYKPGSLWPWLISNVGILIDSCGVFVNYVFFTYVFSSGRFPSYSLHDWFGLSCIAQKPIGPEFCLVRWYLLCTAKSAADRIPIHGLALSTYVYCRLYVSYVQDSLVLYLLFLRFSYPMDYLGKQI